MRMTSSITVSAKIPKDLHDRLVDYRERNDLPSDSAAMRELIRYGLRDEWLEVYVWAKFLGVDDSELSEIGLRVPEFRRAVLSAVSDQLEAVDQQMDLLSAAGGPENLSSREIEALYRLKSEEQTDKDAIVIFDQVLPKIRERYQSGEIEGPVIGGEQI